MTGQNVTVISSESETFIPSTPQLFFLVKTKISKILPKIFLALFYLSELCLIERK